MRWLILFGLWLSYMAFGVVVTSLAPLVPVIQADLDMSYSAMGSVLGAWQVVYIFAAVPAGILLDRLGGRWALTLGIALIVASSAGRAMADNYWMLLAAVMVFGIGGPIVSSGAPKIVTSTFTGSQRGLAMGIYMTGPTLGGITSLTLTHSVLLPMFDNDWRSVMLLWGGFAATAMLIWFAIASFAGRRVPGFYQPEPTAGESPNSLAVVSEIGRNPAVRLLLLMAVGAFLINHGLNNWLPELLRSGGRSIVEAGYWAALPMVVGIIGSLTIPRLATPSRRFKILVALCASAATACLALLLPGDSILTAALILQGFVRASLMTVLILTLMELPSVQTRHAGTASGLFFSAAEIGGVLGPLGLGLMYDLTGGFAAGLYGLAAIAAAMALGSVRLSRLARH
jgi:cyanate permease